MERSITAQIEAWNRQKSRKPLILMGARQVGKTWLMEKLAIKLTSENCRCFSFPYTRYERQALIAGMNADIDYYAYKHGLTSKEAYERLYKRTEAGRAARTRHRATAATIQRGTGRQADEISRQVARLHISWV